MSFLLGVPGKLKTLIDRLTSTRAGYLDNLSAYTTTRGAKLDQLDAAVTSRASAANYTSGRAANLDNLNATISSRAAASTALSTSTWTAGRAAKLDDIDIPISAISPIKQIIHGLADDATPSSGTALSIEGAYTDVTIAAVDIAKTVVIVHGFLATISGTPTHIMPRVRFVNSTTVRFGVYANATRLFGPFMLIEFK